jgi:hypothetical protein
MFPVCPELRDQTRLRVQQGHADVPALEDRQQEVRTNVPGLSVIILFTVVIYKYS